MQRIWLITIWMVLLGFAGMAQEVFWPANYDFRQDQDAWLRFNSDSLRHFALRPTRATIHEDTAYASYYNQKYQRKPNAKFLGRKLFREHFIRFEHKDTRIWIDPLVNFQGGMDLEDTASKILSTNTRGIQIQGFITSKVYFYASFYENQSFFPEYMNAQIRATRAVPGQGTPKGFGEGGYDYNMATGFVRFKPNKNLSLQYGHDKLFIGEGYRSVLLSDNAFNYPFLQAELSLFKNKVVYQVNYALLQELKRSPGTLDSETIYRRKLTNVNYLGFKPFKRLEVGVSEVVMWQRWDDSTGTLPYEPLFLNPVPLVNSLVSVDSLNQGYIGLNASYAPIDRYVVYGQALYANEGFNAFQVGAKAYDAFGVNGLHLMGEYNEAKDAYGNGSVQTDFYHYGQNMAFVQGDNSSEWIAGASYSLKGFYGRVRVHGIERELEAVSLVSAEAGYLLNPRYNISVYAGGMLHDSDLTGSTQWVYAGIKTSILNAYYDF